jgi:hypothetical protein
VFVKTSGITAALPAQDMARARAFYIDKVGLQALESGFLEANDERVGLTVGDGVNRLFVYPARASGGSRTGPHGSLAVLVDATSSACCSCRR